MMKKRKLGALDRFQTTFTPLLRYVIAPTLLDKRDREECLSDAMLRAWEAIDGHDPSKATFTTWLSALARNTALNRRRPLTGRFPVGHRHFPLLFARLPVNAKMPEYEPSVWESELRTQLLELGFPEAILYHLGDGPLSRFEGAYGVTVDGAFEDSAGDGSLPSFGTVEVSVRDDRYGFRVVYLAWFR